VHFRSGGAAEFAAWRRRQRIVSRALEGRGEVVGFARARKEPEPPKSGQAYEPEESEPEEVEPDEPEPDDPDVPEPEEVEPDEPEPEEVDPDEPEPDDPEVPEPEEV
jgi:hypothetical protein